MDVYANTLDIYIQMETGKYVGESARIREF